MTPKGFTFAILLRSCIILEECVSALQASGLKSVNARSSSSLVRYADMNPTLLTTLESILFCAPVNYRG